ncbi:MAG: L,D-transpeptidase, partial [Candidatus Saccharimonadales bacterium]
AAAQSVLPQVITVTPVISRAEVAAPGLGQRTLGSKPDHAEDEAPKSAAGRGPLLKRPLELAKRYKLGTAALVLLVVGIAVIQGVVAYESANIAREQKAADKAMAARLPGKPVSGFNVTVPAANFQSRLQSITHQPMTLTVGTLTQQVSSDRIKSWLQITANKQKTEYYIHLNEPVIGNSLLSAANEYVASPVDQVTVDEDGTKVVTVAGQNGSWLNDPATLKTQAKQVAKGILGGQGGIKFNTPLATKPFRSVTPAAFDKLIVVNVTSKKMWIFQNGKQIKTYLVSAGKPSTPTPLGEFHIYAKFTVQDMRGSNPDGTPYFQPQVPWVNYFSAGSAIHGVYWHPLSWFGAINSSHGCVGLPVDEAEWVFDWAPMGTPVITHA